MEQILAEKLAREFKVDPERILREEWELILLKELFESPLGDSLIFRGGTALRLCYGSPRFSDDLDLSARIGINPKRFHKIIEGIPKKYSALQISDLWTKYFTHLAEFKIKEDWFPRPFKLKIEIRKAEKDKKRHELKLISSPVTPLQVVGNVATAEQIFHEKLLALKERKEPRDLFDLWYLGQKLKLGVDTKAYGFKTKDLKQQLREYLPQSFWKIIEIL